MDITTVHTLRFSMRCPNQETHRAAVAIINGGSKSLVVGVIISNLPLPDGTDAATVGSSVSISSADRDKCVSYWEEVQRALSFIGVDVTSP